MKPKPIPQLPENPTLTQYLAHYIASSGLTNKEIARACGFVRPNIVSMIKLGDTRLPLERLGAMARALDLDPWDLFCRWMATYYAETWCELLAASQSRPPGLASISALNASADKMKSAVGLAEILVEVQA